MSILVPVIGKTSISETPDVISDSDIIQEAEKSLLHPLCDVTQGLYEMYVQLNLDSCVI